MAGSMDAARLEEPERDAAHHAPFHWNGHSQHPGERQTRHRRPVHEVVRVSLLFAVLTLFRTRSSCIPDPWPARTETPCFRCMTGVDCAPVARGSSLNLFNANIFYPRGAVRARMRSCCRRSRAPLQWVGVPPLVAYNGVAPLGAFVLNGAASPWARHLSGSTAGGVIGGLVFAFAPFRFDHFDHLEMQLSFWMPLAFLAWHRALETGNHRQFLLASVLAACQVLSCVYYGIFLLTSLASSPWRSRGGNRGWPWCGWH